MAVILVTRACQFACQNYQFGYFDRLMRTRNGYISRIKFLVDEFTVVYNTLSAPFYAEKVDMNVKQNGEFKNYEQTGRVKFRSLESD
jgi:hypothetical protein